MENTPITPPEFNCIPPLITIRNSHGLLPNINYHFRPDGKVDWRKMVPSEFIVPNGERTQETDITKIPDEHLLILLNGFQRVAEIRGYQSIACDVQCPSEECSSAVVSIRWIPNYETEHLSVINSGAADAHPRNTKSFGVNYLTTIAENRAFVRAVRKFLGIPILGRDEIGTDSGSDNRASGSPHPLLEELLKDNRIKFESFVNKMTKEGVSNASSWTTVQDIPAEQVLDLMVRVKTLLASKAVQAALK